MFFIGIFGIGDKIKVHKEFSNVECKCGEVTEAIFYEKFTYFHIFFIPIFKWNREHFVILKCCKCQYKVPDFYIEELKRGDFIDLAKLEEKSSVIKGMGRKKCANCKEHINSEYSFCPYCGNQTK